MNTIAAIGIGFGLFVISCPFAIAGLFLIGPVSFPGTALFCLGRKLDQQWLEVGGFIVTLLIIIFVQCIWAISVGIVCIKITAQISPIPQWPIWICGWLISGSLSFSSSRIPRFLSKYDVQQVVIASTTISGLVTTPAFLAVIFVPHWISPVFGWMPYFPSINLSNP